MVQTSWPVPSRELFPSGVWVFRHRLVTGRAGRRLQIWWHSRGGMLGPLPEYGLAPGAAALPIPRLVPRFTSWPAHSRGDLYHRNVASGAGCRLRIGMPLRSGKPGSMPNFGCAPGTVA